MSAPIRRLYRSRRHRVLGGVCGGIADYFNLDPVIVRVLWVLFSLAGGAGILTYIAALFIMENDPREDIPPEETPHPSSQRAFWGTVLIVIGLVFMFTTFRWLYFPFFHIRWEIVLATLLITVGVAVIFFGGAFALSRGDSEPRGAAAPEPVAEGKPTASVRRLYRSRDVRILFGICGGLANYFNLDPVLVRLVWLLLSFFSGGAGFLVYLVLVVVIPEEP